MKTKNLFLATILVVFGAVNENIAQTNYFGSSNMAFGYVQGVYTTTGGQNIFMGANPASVNTSGYNNIFIGTQSGFLNTIGYNNVCLGSQTGMANTSGYDNTFLGRNAGHGNTEGFYNTSVGLNSGYGLTGGDYNSFFGYAAGYLSRGDKNICIGYKSGEGLTTGNYNTFLGYVITNNSDVSNTIILADGQEQQRFYIHSNGYAGIGLGNNVIPQNRLEVKYGAANNSGLRFTNLPNTSSSITNTTNKVLSVNSTGDVILVDDKLGDVLPDNLVTNSCAVGDFVPKVDTSNTDNFVCSQIYDNGTSVGIATTTGFTYDFATTGIPPFTGGTLPMSGTVRLNVNGIIKTTGIFATSDQKFKRDIKSINSALKTVEALEGKTYFWDKKANGNLDFDNAPHSGFLAQDIEKVLPHLVITDEKGLKAVNYLEIIPYLVESIKEQQTQINELKYLVEKLVEKETTINTSDVKLANTKIINVTPNPSKGDVVVTLFVEKEVSGAQLVIFDLTGKKRGSFEINDFDANSNIKLSKENYGEGTFILSLFANNKIVDSKKVIFN